MEKTNLYVRYGWLEIHCWNEETEEIKTALKFGKEKSTDWEFGTIIQGVIDEKFIEMINHTVKPHDITIYNKMTSLFFMFCCSEFPAKLAQSSSH
ncbi:MAG TPA: hypothetical protein DCX82_17320 [Lachnospiraceae bacterium]|jgi:hypothetical protein|nr:hypothetical protein [Lachnospiraceae bacterium]